MSYLAYIPSAMAAAMPSQTVSMTTKEETWWQEENMDFFDTVSQSQHAERERDIKKFKLVAGEFDFTDYSFITDPLSLGTQKVDKYGETPEIKHFPIVSRPINVIVGERINRPLNYYVKSEGTRRQNQYLQTKSDLLMEYVMSQIEQEVTGQPPQQGQEPEPPEHIEKYMNTTYRDTSENIANRLLRNLEKRSNLMDEFVDGFQNSVITGKQFYYIYSVGPNVKIKSISPVDVFYHKSDHQRWVSESSYAGFRWYVTPAAAIDLCRENLKIEDLQKIEQLVNGNRGRKKGDSKKLNFYGAAQPYETSTFLNAQGERYDHAMVDRALENFFKTGNRTVSYNNYGMVSMVVAFWRSYREAAFLTFYDQEDKEQTQLVDENYKAYTDEGEYLQKFYINQIYQGTKIAEDIYLQVQPYKHQFFDWDDPGNNPLPIEGYVHTLHSRPFGLVDMMIPWQELYNIIAYDMRNNIRKAIGRVMFMSYDHIPNIPGFDMNKWMYWLREFGIAWVADNNKRSTFSHYSAQDMTLIETIMGQMSVLEKLKYECDSFAGFSPTRISNSSAAENTLGQSERNLAASVHQTALYFFKHEQCVQRCLQQALNIYQRLIKEYKIEMINLFDDQEIAYIENDLEAFPYEKISVFVTSEGKDLQERDLLKQIMLEATKNGGDPVDMADIVMSRTENEIRTIMKEIRKRNQEAAKQQQQLEQKTLELKEKEIADKAQLEREKLRSAEKQAYIRSFAFKDDNTSDSNSDNVPDIMQYEQFNLDSQKRLDELVKNTQDFNLRRQQMVQDGRLRDKELQLKEKELQVEKDNQKNDYDIAKLQARARNKPSSK